MENFVQQLINGTTLGAFFGLVAIGYTMVYGIIGMINFAHGDIYMIGSFIAFIGIAIAGSLGLLGDVGGILLALLLVLALSMVFTGLYGWSVERIAYRPLRGSFRLAPLISAIGMSIALQNYVQLVQGARPRALQPIANEWSAQAAQSGDTVQMGFVLMTRDDGFTVVVNYLQIFIILVTIALMIGFTLIITRTALGRAQRACEQDKTMAALLGVNVDRTISITFVMGAALAAVAGMMAVLYYGAIDFYDGFIIGVKAFTAAVLGGIGSLPGAMLGGLLIGLIEAFWSAYVSVEYKDVAVFSILVSVLIFRPTGLLGKPQIEKV
ncbi:MAG: branched-chain amino acid ABC transporter permease LivH [Alphaproteobacteria bacterium]